MAKSSFLSKKSAPAKNTWGTPEEIAARDEGGYQPEPTAFKQPGFEDQGGVNPASPGFTRRDGNFKFSKGV